MNADKLSTVFMFKCLCLIWQGAVLPHVVGAGAEVADVEPPAGSEHGH